MIRPVLSIRPLPSIRLLPLIRTLPVAAIGLVLLTLSIGCTPSPSSDEAAPASDDVGSLVPADEALVATWEGGSLSTEALDQAILALPPPRIARH